MKYVCLDYDTCGWFYYLTSEDYKDHLPEVVYCEECANLAVLVKKDFDIASVLEANQTYMILQEEE